MGLGGEDINPLWALPSLVVAVLAIGAGVLIFQFTSSPQSAHPPVPRVTFLVAGSALLFGLFLVINVIGCLLEAVSPQTFGSFPDPELAPWLCLVAVTVLVPTLAVFRTRLFTGARLGPRRLPLLASSCSSVFP